MHWLRLVRQAEPVQVLYRLDSGLDDVNQPFVSSNPELLTRLLFNEGIRENGETFNPGRQGNQTFDFAMSPFGRINNFQSALVQNCVVIRFHTDPDHVFRCSTDGSRRTRWLVIQRGNSGPLPLVELLEVIAIIMVFERFLPIWHPQPADYKSAAIPTELQWLAIHPESHSLDLVGMHHPSPQNVGSSFHLLQASEVFPWSMWVIIPILKRDFLGSARYRNHGPASHLRPGSHTAIVVFLGEERAIWAIAIGSNRARVAPIFRSHRHDYRRSPDREVTVVSRRFSPRTAAMWAVATARPLGMTASGFN